MKINSRDNESKELANGIDTLIEDAQALIAATKDVATEKVVEARQRLVLALESGKEACERLREEAVNRADLLDERIRENPYGAIGIAFGIGAFTGMLLMGRRSR